MKKTSMWDIIKKYHWESAFFKNCFKWFSVILICIFVIGIILTVFTTVSTNTSAKQSNDLHYNNIHEKIEASFSSIDEFNYLLTNDYNVSKYIFSMTSDQNDLAMTVKSVTSLMNSFIYSNSYMHSVYLYVPHFDYIISPSGSSEFDTFFDTGWSDDGNGNNSARIISRNIDSTECITMCTPVIINGQPTAYAIYNINSKNFTEYLINDSYSHIQLTDNDNNIIFNTKSSEEILSAKPEYTSILPYNLILRVNFSASHSQKFQYKLVFLFWIIFIFLFIMDIFVSYKLSINYFSLIVENIMQFQTPYSKVEVFDDYLKEFNIMLHNPSRKTAEQNAEQFLINQYSKLRSMQLISLQEQINPHFVFNTLHLISLLSLDDDDNSQKIADISEKLSNILHYSIETDSNMVGLEDEIYYLDQYVEIQNIKYNNKFKYVKELDNNVSDCKIMKFSLQPIIENAITHGILNTPSRKGSISLKVHKEDNILKINISNDGAQIPADRLAELQNTLEQYTESVKDHVGMVNVNNRIKLMFGDEYGCRIISTPELTTVTITMPYII